MPDLPTEWGALAALALLFGLKHGFDADHMATIDALTRVNTRHGERHARWCDALFALGHGAAVVLMVAGLFALGGTASGGLGHALALGALFALGMLCTDAFNGLWVARLISGTGQMTATASRATSLAVALVSLLVAGLGVGKWASASVDGWAKGKELVFGVAVIAIVTASGLLARWLARRDGARLSACASSSAPAPGS